MPLKQGTEILPYHHNKQTTQYKKDAPKAGDGNCLPIIAFLYCRNI